MSAVALVLMTDPAIGYLPGQGYGPYDLGTQLDLWVKSPNGSASFGVVWPGMFRSTSMTKQPFQRFVQVSLFFQVRAPHIEMWDSRI
jgi:alpha-glucosidase (family GH31 glycosyl hydrolase)